MLISVVLEDFSTRWCFTHFISCCNTFIYGVDYVSQQILYFMHGIYSCWLLLWYRLFLRIFQSRQDFLLILGAICGLKLVRMLRGIDLFDLGVAYVNKVLEGIHQSHDKYMLDAGRNQQPSLKKEIK